jgi:hypothetical protein
VCLTSACQPTSRHHHHHIRERERERERERKPLTATNQRQNSCRHLFSCFSLAICAWGGSWPVDVALPNCPRLRFGYFSKVLSSSGEQTPRNTCLTQPQLSGRSPAWVMASLTLLVSVSISVSVSVSRARSLLAGGDQRVGSCSYQGGIAQKQHLACRMSATHRIKGRR